MTKAVPRPADPFIQITRDAPQAPATADAITALPTITPADWAGPCPDRRWLAKDRIPAGDVTALLGDGATGKTQIAKQLEVAVARGAQDWLGTVIEAGPVLCYSGEEDEDENQRRIERIAEIGGFSLSALSDLHIYCPDPDKALLGEAAPNDMIKPTTEFHRLRKSIETIRPALVTIDSVAATYGGSQNSRTQTRSYINMFRALSRSHGTTFLLLDHPSMAGLASGEGRGGSVDWQNAVRSRMYLKHLGTSKNDEEEGIGDLRELATKKTNYGPRGEAVRLRWSKGIFVVDGAATPIEQAATEQRIDDLFLKLLDQLTAQDRYVTPARSRSGAAATFANHPDAGSVTARAFEKAQERLFGRDVLVAESWGPKSRGKQRIKRKAR